MKKLLVILVLVLSATAAIAQECPFDVTVTADRNKVCYEGQIVFTANVTGGTAAAYQWYREDESGSGPLEGEVGVTYEPWRLGVSGEVWVEVTDADGCVEASPRFAYTVVQWEDLTITSTPPRLCAGGSVTLSVRSAAEYHWSTEETTQSIVVTEPGIYEVYTVDEDGCQNGQGYIEVTLADPKPTITMFPSNGAICPGREVHLYANGGGPSYLWSNGETGDFIIVTEPGQYTVRGIDENCTADSDPVTVTTQSEVTITADGPTTFCAGGSVRLSAPEIEGATYSWSNNATWPTILVLQSGSYWVTVQLPNGCLLTSNTIDVVSSNPPTPNISTSGPTTFCEGGSVTLTAPAGYTYRWSNDATTQSIVVTQSGSYSVTITDAYGCSKTSSALTVTVKANPPATITPSGPTTFCQGGSVTLSAPAGQSFYRWSNNAIGQSIVVTESGNYSVTVTGSNGCTATSAPTTVTVHGNAPTPQITQSGPVTFCEGGSVTLTAPSGFASYRWSNDATTQSIVVTQSGDYSVTVTNSGGCSATSSPRHVTVYANPPVPTVTANGPTTFCEGGSVTLTAPAGYTYVWSNNATTQSIVVSQSGSYSVTVRNGNGCTASSAPTTVTVNANPPAPTVTAGGPTTFCPGGSVTLTAPAGYSYLWSNNATTQSIVVSQPGSYSVTVMNASGCSASSASTTVSHLAATAITAQPQSITIPKNTSTTLSVTASGEGTVTYQWFRGTSGSGTAISGATASTYNTGRLGRGTYSYWVRVTAGCGVVNSNTAVVTVN